MKRVAMEAKILITLTVQQWAKFKETLDKLGIAYSEVKYQRKENHQSNEVTKALVSDRNNYVIDLLNKM